MITSIFKFNNNTLYVEKIIFVDRFYLKKCDCSHGFLTRNNRHKRCMDCLRTHKKDKYKDYHKYIFKEKCLVNYSNNPNYILVD